MIAKGVKWTAVRVMVIVVVIVVAERVTVLDVGTMVIAIGLKLLDK